jgi:hypothetical protein
LFGTISIQVRQLWGGYETPNDQNTAADRSASSAQPDFYLVAANKGRQMTTDNSTTTVFIIVETPYDTYRIRTVCRTHQEAVDLCAAHEDETDYPFDVHEVAIGAPWLGIGYDDGYEN